MKTFFSALVMAAVLCFTAGSADAQQSKLKVGDGGTTIKGIKMGRVTLVAGVATVSDTSVAATTKIFVERQAIGGTAGQTYDVTRTAGTSFTITARAADGTTAATGDTSVLDWIFFQP